MHDDENTPRRGLRQRKLGLALGLTLGSLALVGTGLAVAGAKGGCEGWGERGHHAKAWMHGGDGEISAERLDEMKERLLERAGERLELSEEQRQQAGAILDAATPQALAGLQRLGKGRESLRDSAAVDSYDEAAVSEAAAEMGEAVAELATLRSRVLHELSGTLNETQQQQLKEMLEKRGGRWGHHS